MPTTSPAARSCAPPDSNPSAVPDPVDAVRGARTHAGYGAAR